VWKYINTKLQDFQQLRSIIYKTIIFSAQRGGTEQGVEKGIKMANTHVYNALVHVASSVFFQYRESDITKYPECYISASENEKRNYQEAIIFIWGFLNVSNPIVHVLY